LTDLTITNISGEFEDKHLTMAASIAGDVRIDDSGDVIADPCRIKTIVQFMLDRKADEARYLLGADLSRATNRVPLGHYRLMDKNNDLEAIQFWLKERGKKSESTLRTYRKEVARFLLWSVAIRYKPLSDLNAEDILEYETFLKAPLPSWTTQGLNQSHDIDFPLQLEEKDRWRPFEKALSLHSIEQCMEILKSMYNFWCTTGYVHLNPLSVRSKVVTKSDRYHEHVLTPDHWQFIYEFLTGWPERIKAETEKDSKERAKKLQIANRAQVIFDLLYLMGLRISELANLKMSDFDYRYYDVKGHWWATVTGKGNKTREFSVTEECIATITKYRKFIIDNSERWKYDCKKGKHKKGELKKLPQDFAINPTSTDQSTVLLSLSGTKKMSANALHTVIKDLFKAMGKELKRQQSQLGKYVNVDATKFDQATTHWMRHTSATHRALQGINMQHLQEFLGHESLDTSMIYSHTGRTNKQDDLDRLKLNKT